MSLFEKTILACCVAAGLAMLGMGLAPVYARSTRYGAVPMVAPVCQKNSASCIAQAAPAASFPAPTTTGAPLVLLKGNPP